MFLGLMLGATGAGGDEALFRAINGLGQGPELIVEIFDPHTRNYVILTAIAVAAAALTRPRRIPHVLLFVTLSWILAAGIQRGIHVFWNRPRPEEVLGTDALLLDGRSWAAIASFPSGHMVITTALVIAIARLFPLLRLPLLLYLAVIAFTRILYGAHFPLDVIGGMAIGYWNVRAIEVLLTEVGLLEREVPRGRSVLIPLPRVLGRAVRRTGRLL